MGYVLPKKPLTVKVCQQCYADFKPYRQHQQRFCSEACQQRNYYETKTRPRRQRKFQWATP